MICNLIKNTIVLTPIALIATKIAKFTCILYYWLEKVNRNSKIHFNIFFKLYNEINNLYANQTLTQGIDYVSQNAQMIRN